MRRCNHSLKERSGMANNLSWTVGSTDPLARRATGIAATACSHRTFGEHPLSADADDRAGAEEQTREGARSREPPGARRGRSGDPGSRAERAHRTANEAEVRRRQAAR